MLGPIQASMVWLKSENTWRVKIRFAGSYVERVYPHDQRWLSWEYIQTWLTEDEENNEKDDQTIRRIYEETS